MLQKLISLYGPEKGEEIYKKLENLIMEAKKEIVCEDRPLWDEKDIFLITYPDSFTRERLGRLGVLGEFLDSYLRGVIGGVHILPFFPYTSDRGFSVADYYSVKKEFGNWKEVEAIARDYRLMVDLVLNHVSTSHPWFRKFIEGDEAYERYFIWFRPEDIPHEELKKVERPRPTPVLTRFETAKGERCVWTTFSVENSTDQVDLNYKNPEVFLEIIKVILFLLKKGVRIFRLDAIPYIWKELGTSCANLPQGHMLVSILRDVLDSVCSSALIVAQAASSFTENVSYFGDKDREAQLVYNFSLSPLTLHAFYSQKNTHLNALAARMTAPQDECTFFNILAVHDGISITGAKAFLSEDERTLVYETVRNNEGEFSYRILPDGKKTIREMNITWWSALNKKNEEPFDLQLKKFITSHAIAMSLAGIPAVYYISLFGRPNDLELYRKTGIKRDINRSNIDLTDLDDRLAEEKFRDFGEISPTSPRILGATLGVKVFGEMKKLINRRKKIYAFHPNARQESLNLDTRVFSLLRSDGRSSVLALHNLSKDRVEVEYLGKKYMIGPYEFEWEEIK